MALTRQAPGSPGIWSIGAAGAPPDRYPCRTVDRPRLSTQNGKLVEVVTIIALRTNQAGEPYTNERLVNTRFLEDRNTREPMLDGPQGSPMGLKDLIASHLARVQEYQASQTQELSLDALNALTD